MKKIIIFLTFLTFVALTIIGCDEFNRLNSPEIDLGSADFTRFVCIGNSLTAGYQSGSLYKSSQLNCYGNLIANVIGTNFEQPLYSDPGTGGRLEVESLAPFTLYTNTDQGSPINLNYPAPYNNLGIPGALLYDVLSATNSTDCASYIFAGEPNPMFDLVLRNSVLQIGTQIQQATTLQPTLLIVWIGNNDVLGYATSGGTSPSSPTSEAQFTFLYNTLGDALAVLGTDVIVGNVFDVSTIPFFTTVGPQMSQGIPWYTLAAAGVPGLIFQNHGENIGTGIADSLTLLTGGVLITLTGGNYAGLIGIPTGKFYTDNDFPGLPAGIDTTKPFGVHPQNPWPDAFVLDIIEIATSQNATESFNNIISDVAGNKGFKLVDFNTILKDIRSKDFTGGTSYNGVSFTTRYVEGGLFSLDGVHPTFQGQAIMANEIIKALNINFNAQIPLIDVSTIPGSLNFGGGVVMKNGYPIFPKDAFNHLLY
jgi:lysophospholipase L1-like esterase